jgi:hypothetical protein
MTNEQILELAKTCKFDSFTGEKDDGTQTDYWECWEEQLIEFALKIHKMGYDEGWNDGVNSVRSGVLGD